MNEQDSNFNWDFLLRKIEKKQVIPIIGQDLLNVTIDGNEQPLQHWLVPRLADKLKVDLSSIERNNSQPLTLNDVSLAFLDQDRNNRQIIIYDEIESLLEEPQLPIPKALEQLASISDFNLFVHLGFDKLLEKSIDHIRFNRSNQTKSLAYGINRRIDDLPYELKKLPSPYVFHLFGLAGTTNEFAVTEEDHLELLYSLQIKEKRPQLLFDELRYNHLLFLGCSLPNWLQRFLIRIITNGRLRDSRDTSEFIADYQLRLDHSLAFFLQHYGTINYLGNPSKFIEELHKRWSVNNQRSQIQLPGTTSFSEADYGKVFLSFSSIDREKARSIKDTLEKAHLDVWFDEKNLPPGSEWNEEIKHAIENCSVFLPCISKKAAQTLKSYFRSEWKFAINTSHEWVKEYRFIRPIIVDDSTVSIEGIPSDFWDKQAIRLQDGKLPEDFVNDIKKTVQKYELWKKGKL